MKEGKERCNAERLAGGNIVDVGRAGNGASPAIQPKSNP